MTTSVPPPRKRRFSLAWIAAAVLIVSVGVIWWYNHRETDTDLSQGRRGGMGGRHGGFGMFGPLPVVAVPSAEGDIHVYLNGLGAVTPLATVTVHTQISGQLIKVAFQEGQMVKKGDLLAIVDPRPYEVALEQAEGQLLQAQAQLKEAQADLSRYQTLSQQDSIAQQQVDAQRALVAQDQGLVETDQAAIDSAKLNLTYCHITAPCDGRVGLRQVDQGNYVTPGDSNGLVVLTQIKPITVIFTLPEDNVPQVSARLRSGEPIPVDAYDRTSTHKLASGTLTTIDNEVDPSTGTFKLRATFANDEETLFPNQFVNVQMLVDVISDSIVIPTSAIERGDQGTYVYVVKPDNTVTARNVTLGAIEGERQAVTSGLDEGDMVVVDGADRLREGMQVTVQTPAQAEKAAGALTSGAGDSDRPHRHHRQGQGGAGGAGGQGKGDSPGQGGGQGHSWGGSPRPASGGGGGAN